MKFVKFCSIFTVASIFFINIGYQHSEAVTLTPKKISDESNIVQLLNEDEIPDAIEYEIAKEKGHCDRISDEEKNLNTLIFKNIDGTQSQYIFNYPVKYVDATGDIQDKSLEMKEDYKTNSIISSSSDISVKFNRNLTDGVQLKYEDVNVKMIPKFSLPNNSEANLSDDQKNVIYDFNNDLSIEYSLTYQGIKENIILDEYTGVNEFSFKLLTNGLELKQDENDDFNLYDENDISKANIGKIVVCDAENNISMGNLSYKTIKNCEEYLLTVSVDKNYLTDKNTKYPINIDPTIEIDYSHYGTESYDGGTAIAHCTISSDEKMNFGGTMTIGKINSTEYRTLMKFPILFSSVIKSGYAVNKYGFLAMDENQISNVKVYLREVGYQSDINAMNVYCHEFKEYWGENSSFTWEKGYNKYDPQPLSVQNICHSNGAKLNPLHTYAFDITSLAKKWLSESYMSDTNIRKGLMFKADDSVENGDKSLYCSFGSYNSGYYAPYLVIDYTTPYGYEYKENAPISYTYRTNINLNANQKYIFQTEKSTSNADCDTELYLFKNDMNPGNYSWFNDDMSSSSRYSKIEAEIKESGSYVLMAKCYDSIGKSGVCNKGYCNIYQIDANTQTKTLLKENALLGGYRLALNENNYFSKYDIYNSFTANLNNCDTVMYAFSEDTSNNTKKVIGYNDDYSGSGDFYWGRASRIKQSYDNNNKPRYIFVSAYFESTSNGYADIYGLCKGTYSSVTFPNLKEDDSIVSAPYTMAYNCIAYSGGLTNEWINPQLTLANNNNIYLTPWYNEDNEKALDNFYGNNPPRYEGATTYTVTNNPSESVINVYKNGNQWTHASVRKPGNNQPHGYGWESKLGNGPRVFHALNSLDNDDTDSKSAYGHVERRYKIADSNTKSASYNLAKTNINEITFEDSVELGLTKVQNINIENNELNLLNNELKLLSNNEKNEFDVLYSDWINKILNDDELSVVSNSAIFIQIDEYKKLSQYIDNNNKLLYYIIDEYINSEQDVFITTLFNDKVVANNEKTIEAANNIRNKNNNISARSINDSVYIAPTYETNALCFIKEILNDESGAIFE